MIFRQAPSRFYWGEFLIETLIRVSGFSAIFFVALIFIFLVREGAPAFWKVSLNNLFGTRWYPIFDIHGTLPLILGSVAVTLGAVAIALPLGLATAIYIGEIAPAGCGRFSSLSSKCWPVSPRWCWAFWA